MIYRKTTNPAAYTIPYLRAHKKRVRGYGYELVIYLLFRLLALFKIGNLSFKLMEQIRAESSKEQYKKISKNGYIKLFSAPEIYRSRKLKQGKHRYYELPLTLTAQEITWELGASYYSVFAADTRETLLYSSPHLISVNNQHFLLEYEEGKFGGYFTHTSITQEEFDAYLFKNHLYTRYCPLHFKEKILHQTFTFQSEFFEEFKEELFKNS